MNVKTFIWSKGCSYTSALDIRAFLNNNRCQIETCTFCHYNICVIAVLLHANVKLISSPNVPVINIFRRLRRSKESLHHKSLCTALLHKKSKHKAASTIAKLAEVKSRINSTSGDFCNCDCVLLTSHYINTASHGWHYSLILDQTCNAIQHYTAKH